MWKSNRQDIVFLQKTVWFVLHEAQHSPTGRWTRRDPDPEESSQRWRCSWACMRVLLKRADLRSACSKNNMRGDAHLNGTSSPACYSQASRLDQYQALSLSSLTQVHVSALYERLMWHQGHVMLLESVNHTFSWRFCLVFLWPRGCLASPHCFLPSLHYKYISGSATTRVGVEI